MQENDKLQLFEDQPIRTALDEENLDTAKQGGSVAGNARKEIEEKTGKSVISSENAESMLMGSVVTEMIEKFSDDK